MKKKIFEIICSSKNFIKNIGFPFPSSCSDCIDELEYTRKYKSIILDLQNHRQNNENVLELHQKKLAPHQDPNGQTKHECTLFQFLKKDVKILKNYTYPPFVNFASYFISIP